MPRVDGWTVLQALKADPELSITPVIMLSVCEEKNLGYFEKGPSTLEQLLHEVGRLLARPRNRPANGQRGELWSPRTAENSIAGGPGCPEYF